MSAGTGIYHAEYNKNPNEPVKFLQIWIFPNKRDVTPRYDQIKLDLDEKPNVLNQILSPDKDDAGVWIHQDAWFHIGRFDQGKTATYNLKKDGNGIYFFVLKGNLNIEDQILETRDGLGLWDTSEVKIEAATATEFLIMEVPMEVRL